MQVSSNTLSLWFTVSAVYNFIPFKLQFIWLIDLKCFGDLFLYLGSCCNLHMTRVPKLRTIWNPGEALSLVDISKKGLTDLNSGPPNLS